MCATHFPSCVTLVVSVKCHLCDSLWSEAGPCQCSLELFYAAQVSSHQTVLPPCQLLYMLQDSRGRLGATAVLAAAIVAAFTAPALLLLLLMWQR